MDFNLRHSSITENAVFFRFIQKSGFMNEWKMSLIIVMQGKGSIAG